MDKRELYIANLTERIGRLLTAESHIEGLQPVHWEVLRYLQMANKFSRTPIAITNYLGLTKGTVSQTLATLNAKKLITKTPDKFDRRVKRISLTNLGNSLLSKDPLLRTQRAVSKLPEHIKENLLEGLESILIHQLNERDRRPFGQCQYCIYFQDSHPQGDPFFCGLLEEKLSTQDSLLICAEQQYK